MGNKIQRKRQQDRRRAHANRSSSPYGTFVVDGLGEPVTLPAIGVDDLSGFKPQGSSYDMATTVLRQAAATARSTGEPVVVARQPAVPRGRCGTCGTRHKLRRVDGGLTAHQHGDQPCAGVGSAPVDEP